VPQVTAFSIPTSIVSKWWMGVIAMFYTWLVDGDASTRKPTDDQRDHTLPGCGIDAIGLFNKRSCVRSRPCRFVHF
jgi:hypothetical protein